MVPRNSHKENNLFAIIDTRILLIQMHPYIVQQHVPSNSNYDRRSGQEHALNFLMIICHMVTQPAPKKNVSLFVYLSVCICPAPQPPGRRQQNVNHSTYDNSLHMSHYY